MNADSIIVERSAWVAVNKPAGVSVHNEAEDLLTQLERLIGVRPYPVHRLDRATSGVMLLAKDAGTAAYLQTQLGHSDTRKRYEGILRGQLHPNSGTWRQPLSNRGEGRRNPQGRRAARIASQTNYDTLNQNTYLTRATFHLQTGRQHQIRRHAALSGHAIVGDSRYGDKRYNDKFQSRYGFSGMCLHARSLEIVIAGELLTLSAAPPLAWEVFGC